MIIQQREIDKMTLESLNFVKSDLSEIEKRILSTRIKNKEFPKFYPSTQSGDIDLPDGMKLKNIGTAIPKIIETINNNEKIIVACDYDADGLGAASIIKMGLNLLYPEFENIEVLVSDRYNGGYGFNQNVAEKIVKEKNKTLVITVDQGSSDEQRFAFIKETNPNIEVIVTDHHHVPENYPKSVHAFINPNQKGDIYPEKDICGAAVALLLIKTLKEHIPVSTKIGQLLEICAISTIGDVMPLNNPKNRNIVKYGLKKANSNTGLPFWKAIKADIGGVAIDESTIGFNIAPKINAMSRIGTNPQVVVDFLTSKDEFVINDCYQLMAKSNDARKEINEDLYKQSLEQVENQDDDFINIVFLEHGLSGVTGIVASKIKEQTGKPTICFCPKQGSDSGEVTGSGRSIEGVDIRKMVEIVSNSIEMNFGGHPMACGLTLKEKDLPLLKEMLENSVRDSLDNKKPEQIIEYDFDVIEDNIDISFETIETLNKLKPYGQKFVEPNLKIQAQINSLRWLDKGHLLGDVIVNGKTVKMIWFAGNMSSNFDKSSVQTGMEVSIIGKISVNSFRGVDSIQIMVDTMVF